MRSNPQSVTPPRGEPSTFPIIEIDSSASFVGASLSTSTSSGCMPWSLKTVSHSVNCCFIASFEPHSTNQHIPPLSGSPAYSKLICPPTPHFSLICSRNALSQPAVRNTIHFGCPFSQVSALLTSRILKPRCFVIRVSTPFSFSMLSDADPS